MSEEHGVGGRVPDLRSEERLVRLREEAAEANRVDGEGVRPKGAPFPQATSESGYYGLPLLEAPAWKPSVPVYFFVGGAAGAAAVVGAAARLVGADPALARDARRIAAVGGALSPALLIEDLGRPARFLNMLRVFKPRSTMSMGAWTLVGFSTTSAAAAFADLVEERYGRSMPVRVLGDAAQVLGLPLSLAFSNYTGVLLGTTAIPVWNENVGTLPVHFGISGLASAVAMLELLGHRSPALGALAIGAAALESLEGARVERDRRRATAPLRRGRSGAWVRAGAVLSGPLPLALRAAAAAVPRRQARPLRVLAAVSAITGSLATRFGWVRAGSDSARDPAVPLDLGGAPEDETRPLGRPPPPDVS